MTTWPQFQKAARLTDTVLAKEHSRVLLRAWLRLYQLTKAAKSWPGTAGLPYHITNKSLLYPVPKIIYMYIYIHKYIYIYSFNYYFFNETHMFCCLVGVLGAFFSGLLLGLFWAFLFFFEEGTICLG